jgi:hypothetical protein
MKHTRIFTLAPCEALGLPRKEEKQITKYFNRKEPKGKRAQVNAGFLGQEINQLRPAR